MPLLLLLAALLLPFGLAPAGKGAGAGDPGRPVATCLFPDAGIADVLNDDLI